MADNATPIETLHRTALAVWSASETVEHCVDSLLLRYDAPAAPVPIRRVRSKRMDRWWSETDYPTAAVASKYVKYDWREVFRSEYYMRSFSVRNPCTRNIVRSLPHAHGEMHRPNGCASTRHTDDQAIPTSDAHALDAWRKSIVVAVRKLPDIDEHVQWNGITPQSIADMVRELPVLYV